MDNLFARAFEALLQDLYAIYYRCGAEVPRENKYGEIGPYWPNRYFAGVKIAERLGMAEVLAYVKRIVTRRKPTRGFTELLAANRPDLTVEALVADPSKPYHELFDPETIALARARLGL